MKGLVPVAMLLIGCGRPREHPKGHFRSKDSLIGRNHYFRLRIRAPFQGKPPFGVIDLRSLRVMFHNITYGQKALRILHNFRLCMRTPKGTPFGVTLDMVLYYCITFCTTTMLLQMREMIAHAQAITSMTSGSGLFRWRHFQSRDFR